MYPTTIYEKNEWHFQMLKKERAIKIIFSSSLTKTLRELILIHFSFQNLKKIERNRNKVDEIIDQVFC